jgi:hypothetical protein
VIPRRRFHLMLRWINKIFKRNERDESSIWFHPNLDHGASSSNRSGQCNLTGRDDAPSLRGILVWLTDLQRVCVFVLGLPLFGAVLTTNATCNIPFGVASQVVQGTMSASCNVETASLSAQAKASATSSPYDVSAAVGAFSNPYPAIGASATASATFDADLTFTILGGVGEGAAIAVFEESIDYDDNSSARASVSLQSDSSTITFGQVAVYYPEWVIPFAYGVPFTLNLYLEADTETSTPDVDGGTAAAEFLGLFAISAGQQSFQADYTVVDATTSEPSGLFFVLVGAAFLILKKRFSANSTMGG